MPRSATARTENYTYDDLNRLSAVSYGDGESQTYSFDAMGNRLGRTDTITPDADGNTLSDSSGRTYTWDSQNRMASCTYQGQTTTFTYGSDGLRRSMTVRGVTTDYAYDGTMLVREFQINQQTGLLAPSVTYMVGPMGPCCRINEQNQSVIVLNFRILYEIY